jgi:hypothetical protein
MASSFAVALRLCKKNSQPHGVCGKSGLEPMKFSPFQQEIETEPLPDQHTSTVTPQASKRCGRREGFEVCEAILGKFEPTIILI